MGKKTTFSWPKIKLNWNVDFCFFACLAFCTQEFLIDFYLASHIWISWTSVLSSLSYTYMPQFLKSNNNQPPCQPPVWPLLLNSAYYCHHLFINLLLAHHNFRLSLPALCSLYHPWQKRCKMGCAALHSSFRRTTCSPCSLNCYCFEVVKLRG